MKKFLDFRMLLTIRRKKYGFVGVDFEKSKVARLQEYGVYPVLQSYPSLFHEHKNGVSEKVPS